MKNLTFSFDIGYNSIGWGVLSASSAADLRLLGTGVVLFESDSCLASKRREYRRMRRTIRARRMRIERIGRIMEHSGLITPEQRSSAGHPAPFFLAARALQGKAKLSAFDVWQLMRWYAHNRGYNGNCPWAAQEQEDAEDSQREAAAKQIMQEHGTTTMCETVCSLLELNTDAEEAELNINSPKYKNLRLAFPRAVVCAEVKSLLRLADIPSCVAELIIGDVREHTQELRDCGVRFPRRYEGSVLFGQLIPRFENRIIARCPITWAHTYRAALSQGRTEAEARKAADKYAKVPNADCEEFYRYRFARILANIRCNNAPLSAELRRAIMADAEQRGKYSLRDFKKLVSDLTDKAPNNLTNYFHLDENAAKALVLKPDEKQRAAGRAPYARPVLRAVTEEVLRGEDPTRPVFSLAHPDGEHKAADGCLYCMQNPDSDEYRLQSERPLDKLTNNHLVRHRMLIFQRLLRDMIRDYADGDEKNVAQCVIEVGRELKEYSGKTAKEIVKLENEKMKDFNAAVRYLEKTAPDLPLSAGIIRKCRIAMDMNWQCPYTGQTYSPADLPNLELEHIVPHASRNTNALSALVLTWPEVNRMKGKRTGLEFIREFAAQPVDGRPNLSVITEALYKKLVDKLNTKGAKADVNRKRTRKKLLMVEHASAKGADSGLNFTEGQMTQSSQLMKLAAQLAKRQLRHATTAMIPGCVTAATRKAWNVMGLLAESTPEVINPTTHALHLKADIRNITHMHHAVDACTLALIPHLIPAGTNGVIWQALAQRKLSDADARRIKQLIGNSPTLLLDSHNRLELRDLPESVKDSVAKALAEKRVMQHVPADMSGAKLVENLQSRKHFLAENQDCEGGSSTIRKELGLNPPAASKLADIKAILPAVKNYGVALLPSPVVIPHLSVYKILKELREQNGGKEPQMLKKGQLIELASSPHDKRGGVWRIESVKNAKQGPKLDLQRPHSALAVGVKSETNWREVLLKSVCTRGFRIIPSSYTGFSVK